MNPVIQNAVVIPLGIILWVAVATALYNFFANLFFQRKAEYHRMKRYELIAEAARIMYDNMVGYGKELGFNGKAGHYIDSDHWAYKQWLDALYDRPIKHARYQ